MKHACSMSVTRALLAVLLLPVLANLRGGEGELLSWAELPSLPEELGVGGPFAGVHNGALIVAGGANFAQPVWENEKVWHDRIFVLTKSKDQYVWRDGGRLPRPLAYGAAVTTPDGVVCIGGNDADQTFDDVFLLKWDASAEAVTATPYPPLPKPCAFGSAALVGNVVYMAGGQHGHTLETALTNFWTLDLSKKKNHEEFVWQQLPPWPGPSRALNLTVHQRNGPHDCVYVISGRRQEGPDAKSVQFLRDVWEYTPATSKWRKRADAPRSIMAGTGAGLGQSHIYVLGGADGSFFFNGNELKDKHPGFPQEALVFHTMANNWTSAGPIPSNHVTTIPVQWNGAVIIPSGEVRPRVRSPKVWSIRQVKK